MSAATPSPSTPAPLRTVFRVTGPDRITFLQGLVSNDVRKVSEGIVYAALLTPQGKYLADFFLIQVDEAILLDVASSIAPAVLQRLMMYKLRADVQISPTDISPLQGQGTPPAGAFLDPRHEALGWRAYNELSSKDQTDVNQSGADQVDWTALYVTHCIPQTGVELTPDSYLLEVGFERLNGVDFRKGCYVGQEVTARMKHKTELKKGLCTVQIKGASPIGSPIMNGSKEVGTLFTQAGGQAMAYLRFDRATPQMTAGEAVISWTDPRLLDV